MPREWIIEFHQRTGRESRTFLILHRGKLHKFVVSQYGDDSEDIPGIIVRMGLLPIRAGKWSRCEYRYQISSSAFIVPFAPIQASINLEKAFIQFHLEVRKAIWYQPDHGGYTDWDKMKVEFELGVSREQFGTFLEEHFPDLLWLWQQPYSMASKLAALE